MNPTALSEALAVFSDKRAMTVTEIRTLLALPAYGSGARIGVREAADKIQVLRPSMSKTITILVGLGYVTRKEDQSDRRLVQLCRSRSGEKLVQLALKRIK
jgi:DNA-binding MarR family transcriptional regulator